MSAVPPTSGEGVEHVTVVEDRGDSRWLTVFLSLFVVVGVLVTLVGLAVGGPWFLLLWGLLFGGMPGAWLWVTRRRVARADFVVSPYGVHGADAAEGEWVAWGDAVAFVWRPTGERINSQPLWALHLLRGDGSTVRLASLGSRRRDHEAVERQIAAARQARLVPDHITIVRAGGREPPTGAAPPAVADDVVGTTPSDPPSDRVRWPAGDDVEDWTDSSDDSAG